MTENEKIFDNCCCCLLQTEVPSPPLIAAAKIAHERGIPVILKPSSRISLEPELLKYTDIIVPNQNEMKTLAPEMTLRNVHSTFWTQACPSSSSPWVNMDAH